MEISIGKTSKDDSGKIFIRVNEKREKLIIIEEKYTFNNRGRGKIVMR